MYALALSLLLGTPLVRELEPTTYPPDHPAWNNLTVVRVVALNGREIDDHYHMTVTKRRFLDGLLKEQGYLMLGQVGQFMLEDPAIRVRIANP